MLIEVVVSAALVSIVAIGVFAGIDGPSAISSTDQQRAIASSLAQQDQDRLRGMRVADLANYQQTQPVTVAGVAYNVTSKAEWVADSSGTVSCSSGSSQANYLKLSSAVSWPSIGKAAPVSLVSLMTPPAGGLGSNRGNLSIQLQDQAGNPVVGVPVDIHVPGVSTLTTNSAGCAFYGYLPVGTYNATFSQLGYVDPGGSNSVAMSGLSVTNGTTTTPQHNYAQAAQVAVSFTTKVGGTPQPAQAQSMTLTSPNLPGAGSLTPPAAPAPQSTLTASGLYPFTSGYGVYAGGCASANPTGYSQTEASVAVQPGGSSAVTVFEPPIAVQVNGPTGLPLNGANVRVTPTGAGCSDVYPKLATGSSGTVTTGLPYGTYRVCADNGAQTVQSGQLSSTTPAGASVTLTVPASGSPGVCP